MSDDAAVPLVEVQVRRQPGGSIETLTCPDALTPRDGSWSCVWSAGALNGVTAVDLRARATDEYGNQSGWNAWRTLPVDATPPTVTLSPATEAALADGVLNTAEAQLAGTVTDNRRAAQVELCLIREGIPPTCQTQTVNPGTAASGTWVRSLLATGIAGLTALDGVPQTWRITGIDGVGNRSTELALSFLLDGVAPQIRLDEVVTAVPVVGRAVPLVQATVTDGHEVDTAVARITTPTGMTHFVTAVQDNDGRWLVTYRPLAPGTYTWRLEAYDVAGNGRATAEQTLLVGATWRLHLPFIAR